MALIWFIFSSPNIPPPWIYPGAAPANGEMNEFKWFGCIIGQRSGLLVWSLASGAQGPWSIPYGDFFFSGYSFLFVFMKWLSKRNWLTTHFGHGDLHPLSCLGLQQADTRPLSTNFYVIQKMSFLKTMYLSQILIGWYSIGCCLFWAVRMDLTSSLTAPKGLNFLKIWAAK